MALRRKPHHDDEKRALRRKPHYVIFGKFSGKMKQSNNETFVESMVMTVSEVTTLTRRK